MTIFELMDQPFNVVHEMYRLVFLKNKYQKEKEEKEKLEAAKKAEEENRAHREKVRSNVPVFATKSHVLDDDKQTPPQEIEKPVEQQKSGNNSSTRTPSSDSVVSQMISSDMQDILEEVIS